MKIPKVESMTSSNGNSIPNQFLLTLPNCVVFQSYTTLIAVKFNDGTIVLSEDYDCNQTTGKYRNDFLGEGIAETRRKVDNGTYRVLSESRLGVLINDC